jgi:hypothetical protein
MLVKLNAADTPFESYFLTCGLQDAFRKRLPIKTDVMASIPKCGKMKVVLNSGATFSRINMRRVEEAGRKKNICPTKMTYRTSSGEIRPVEGKVMVRIDIGDLIIKAPMAVMPKECSYNALIANDIMGPFDVDTSEKASPAGPMPEGADGSAYYRDGACGTGGAGAFLRVSLRLPASTHWCRSDAACTAGLHQPGTLCLGHIHVRQDYRHVTAPAPVPDTCRIGYGCGNIDGMRSAPVHIVAAVKHTGSSGRYYVHIGRRRAHNCTAGTVWSCR